MSDEHADALRTAVERFRSVAVTTAVRLSVLRAAFLDNWGDDEFRCDASSDEAQAEMAAWDELLGKNRRSSRENPESTA